MQTRWGIIALGAALALATPAEAGEAKGFRTTSEIERYIESVAIAEMERQVERPPVHYRRMAAAAAPGAAGGAAGASHSTTNVQVAGVDEADFVKNDAGYIYKLVGEWLVIVDAVPAWHMREVSRTKIEGWPHAMFLNGDKVVVFSTPPAPQGMERPGQAGPGAWWGGIGIRMMIAPGPWYQSTPIVKATVLDVARRSAPQLVREYYLEGSYVDARMVGTQVHFVSTARPPGPELALWQDWSRQPTARELDALKAENRRRIAAATIEDWLPRHWDKTRASQPSLALRPSKCWRPETAEGRSLLTVTTLDLASASPPQHGTIVAEAGELYGSATSMYVACYRWRYWSDTGVGQEPGDTTEIHQLRVGISGGPTYYGTGTVEGNVLNQFAMDEWNGVLRVATTTQATQTRPSENHVFALRRFPFLGRRLWNIGSIRGMAPGERIFSTRFMGERGFVVTFRQIDPLFAIDMRRLEVKGELKVEGVSTYLHPMGTDHLLAVGNAADASGRITGLDISVFDVRDLANPRLAHRRTLAGAYSSSLYEHKAFNFFAPSGVLAIPVSDWQNGFAGLEVYDISTSAGISLRGRVDHGGMARQLGWGYPPECSRSAIIGPALYSISDVGIKASRLARPSSDYKELPLRP